MAYPKKPADNQYPITDLVKQRWSPRVFSSEPITKENMHSLLEAGRWAPSSMNEQPWRIIWSLKGQDVHKRIYDCLDEFNQTWVVNAQAFVLGAYKKTMSSGKQNFHGLYDLASFTAMLTIQAQSMNIGVHQMAGFDFTKANEEFGFGEGYHCGVILALGYFGGRIDDLPKELQAPESSPNRSRHSQDKFAFNGEFQDLIK